jgi:hypothetical protein
LGTLANRDGDSAHGTAEVTHGLALPLTIAVLLSRQRSHAAAPVAERTASTLPALTGLRFVAVLCVVVHHFGTVRVASAGLFGMLQSVGQRLSTYGLLGVNCFCILSGLPIASST